MRTSDRRGVLASTDPRESPHRALGLAFDVVRVPNLALSGAQHGYAARRTEATTRFISLITAP